MAELATMAAALGGEKAPFPVAPALSSTTNRFKTYVGVSPKLCAFSILANAQLKTTPAGETSV